MLACSLLRGGVLAVLLAGCPGVSSLPRDGGSRESGGATDRTLADQPPANSDGRPDTAGGCSATGTLTTCDPLKLQGCQAGACYVAKSAGTACVCPVGSIAAGGECKTTLECAPGHVCAGTTPPGVCRAACDPKSVVPSCAAGGKCTPINDLPQYGYCSL